MKKKDVIKKYNSQKKLITKYNHHYFNLDSPLVTDDKYDLIKREIIELENEFPYLIREKSVQDQVGAPITKKFSLLFIFKNLIKSSSVSGLKKILVFPPILNQFNFFKL